MRIKEAQSNGQGASEEVRYKETTCRAKLLYRVRPFSHQEGIKDNVDQEFYGEMPSQTRSKYRTRLWYFHCKCCKNSRRGQSQCQHQSGKSRWNQVSSPQPKLRREYVQPKGDHHSNIPMHVSSMTFMGVNPNAQHNKLSGRNIRTINNIIVTQCNSGPLRIVGGVGSGVGRVTPKLPRGALPSKAISGVAIMPFCSQANLVGRAVNALRASLSRRVLVYVVIVVILILGLQTSIIVTDVLPVNIVISINIIFIRDVVQCVRVPRGENVHGKGTVMGLVCGTIDRISKAVTATVVAAVIDFLPIFTVRTRRKGVFSPLTCAGACTLTSTFMLKLVLLPALSCVLFSMQVSSGQVQGILGCVLVTTNILLSILCDGVPTLKLATIKLGGLLTRH